MIPARSPRHNLEVQVVSGEDPAETPIEQVELKVDGEPNRGARMPEQETVDELRELGVTEIFFGDAGLVIVTFPAHINGLAGAQIARLFDGFTMGHWDNAPTVSEGTDASGGPTGYVSIYGNARE